MSTGTLDKLPIGKSARILDVVGEAGNNDCLKWGCCPALT